MPDVTYEETKRAIAMVAMSSRLENNCAEESLWQKTTYIMRTSRETNTFVTSQNILKKNWKYTRLKVFTASETFKPLGLLPKI